MANLYWFVGNAWKSGEVKKRCNLLDCGFAHANKFRWWHILLNQMVKKKSTQIPNKHKNFPLALLGCVNSNSLTLIHTNTNKTLNGVTISTISFICLLIFSHPYNEQTVLWYKVVPSDYNKSQTIIEITSYYHDESIVVCYTVAVWIVDQFKVINNDWALWHAYSWPHQRLNDMLEMYFIQLKAGRLLKLSLNVY